MESLVETVLQQTFNSRPSLLQANESTIDHQVIQPMLAALGWGVDQPDEIQREYILMDGSRVDYALFVRQAKDGSTATEEVELDPTPSLIIEVRDAHSELHIHDDQLIDYASQCGATMAAATNGLRWRLYLPLTNRSREERWYFDEQIVEHEDCSVMASMLEMYLGRESMSDGSALLNGARELSISWAVRRTLMSIKPRHRRQLHQMLLDILALSELVERETGHPPDGNELLGHLVRELPWLIEADRQ